MTTHFLTISNLNISKGILTLLDACSLLKDCDADFHLHVVGAETVEISATRFSEEIECRGLQEKVTYHGRQYGEDKEQRLAEASVLVHPTLNDCFPLVLLEAMQHQLPIIATPVGAIPDMVVDGENGFIVPEHEAEALANGMKKLIDNPQMAADMGKLGHDRFLKNYTSSTFENNLVKILMYI